MTGAVSALSVMLQPSLPQKLELPKLFLMIGYTGVDAETSVLLYTDRQLKAAHFG